MIEKGCLWVVNSVSLFHCYGLLCSFALVSIKPSHSLHAYVQEKGKRGFRGEGIEKRIWKMIREKKRKGKESRLRVRDR